MMEVELVNDGPVTFHCGRSGRPGRGDDESEGGGSGDRASSAPSRRGVDRKAWHGPNLFGSVRRLSPEEAARVRRGPAQHPGAGAPLCVLEVRVRRKLTGEGTWLVRAGRQQTGSRAKAAAPFRPGPTTGSSSWKSTGSSARPSRLFPREALHSRDGQPPLVPRPQSPAPRPTTSTTRADPADPPAHSRLTAGQSNTIRDRRETDEEDQEDEAAMASRLRRAAGPRRERGGCPTPITSVMTTQSHQPGHFRRGGPAPRGSATRPSAGSGRGRRRARGRRPVVRSAGGSGPSRRGRTRRRRRPGARRPARS